MNTNPSQTEHRGTFALLETVALNLARHRGNGTYYGIKKISGKRKVHSLDTAHRPTANTKLRDWLASLDTVNPDNADCNLAMLGQKFLAARAGKSVSTVKCDQRIWEHFTLTFQRPMTTLVARVTHSDIAAWLAKIKPGFRSSTYNRWRLFARQLFELAEADGAVPKSPFVDRLNKPARAQKVERPLPTEAEFNAIINEIRVPSWKHLKGRRGGQRPRRQDESADFCEFLGRAGVGQAEASALQWADVDERHMMFTRKKTGRQFSVLITAEVRALLDRRREAAGGAAATGKVFQIANVKTALNHAIARLGCRHFSQRNFRSMKIVGMLDRGVDVKFVALQQGHRDGGRLILDTYSEVIRANQTAYEDEQLARMEGRAGAKVGTRRDRGTQRH